ncbi:hypothetical protein AAFH68_16630 [Flavobacterium sp. CGRL1]
MENTIYEFFIRRCWDCNRFEHGANTDTWEDLIGKHYNFKNANVGNFKNAEREFQKKLELVKSYLDKAFNKLIGTAKKEKIKKEVIEELLQLQAIVANSFEPKEIYDTLKTIFPIMNANEL